MRLTIFRVTTIKLLLIFCFLFVLSSLTCMSLFRVELLPLIIRHNEEIRHIDDLASGYESDVYCDGRALLGILVTSARDHLRHRMVIRETWCQRPSENNHRSSSQCVFLIGQQSSDSVDNATYLDGAIRQEMEAHHDILLGSYSDTYRHLTYKVLHGYYWIQHFCQLPYVLKTDDDCFINAQLITTFLRKVHPVENLYAGRMNNDPSKLTVVRDLTSRWYVSKQDYQLRYYPPYASGLGYLLSIDVVSRIVDHAQDVKLIFVDDAYVGILLTQLGVPPTQSARFVIANMGWHTCNFVYLFVIHDVKPQEQKTMSLEAAKAMKICRNQFTLTWN